MRVVLDTNVLVSGLIYPESLPAKIVSAWLENRYDLALSMGQLAEIGRVLEYPKIRKILQWDSVAIERFLKQLYLRSFTIDIAGVAAEVPSDAGDAMILATVIAARADYLVTGDTDLLALRNRYPILTPAEFIGAL